MACVCVIKTHFNINISIEVNGGWDIAMLGLIHRTVLGKGPPHFSKWFQLQPWERDRSRLDRRHHSRNLESYRHGRYLETYKRSAFGLIDIYNLLPASIVEINTVPEFQKALQNLVKKVSVSRTDWPTLLSPRVPIYCHPLKAI